MIETDPVLAGEFRRAMRRVASTVNVISICVDGEPMGIQTAYLPDALVPGLADELYENASLYDLLRERYGLVPVRARETHIAVALGAEDAALLRVPAGAAALSVQRLACLADGRPLEFVQSLIRGDRYRVVLELEAPQVAR